MIKYITNPHAITSLNTNINAVPDANKAITPATINVTANNTNAVNNIIKYPPFIVISLKEL